MKTELPFLPALLFVFSEHIEFDRHTLFQRAPIVGSNAAASFAVDSQVYGACCSYPVSAFHVETSWMNPGCTSTMASFNMARVQHLSRNSHDDLVEAVLATHGVAIYPHERVCDVSMNIEHHPIILAAPVEELN